MLFIISRPIIYREVKKREKHSCLECRHVVVFLVALVWLLFHGNDGLTKVSVM